MDSLLNSYKMLFAAIGGVLGWLFGGFDSLIYALIAFVIMDYATGVLLAIHDKKISSKIGFNGICKKILIFVLVSMGNVMDQYVFHSGSTLRTLLIMFYLSNEGISILENTGQMGLPMPKKLKETLEQLKDNRDDSN